MWERCRIGIVRYISMGKDATHAFSVLLTSLGRKREWGTQITFTFSITWSCQLPWSFLQNWYSVIFSQFWYTHSLIPLIVSAGFDAADGDDLGECHVTPAGYAHMTNMLCSLANGRIIVALEVFIIIPLIFPRDHSTGRLQPGINLEIRVGGHKSFTGRPAPSTTPTLPKRSRLENRLGSRYGSEPVLGVYGPEDTRSKRR